VLFKISSGSTSAVVHQILSKSDNIFTEIWRFNDFQNGGRTPCWILKICSFCHMACVGMPFCFLVQNFAEIRKSVDELWPIKRFSRWRPPPSCIFKNFNFWSRDYSICYMYRMSSKSDDFSLTWRFNDFQNGGRPPSWISNICRFCYLALVDLVHLPHTKFR